MCIDRQLKAELQRLAKAKGSNLSQFVGTKLNQLAGEYNRDYANQNRPRQQRGAKLNLCLSEQLTTRLLKLADEDYRTLTDFVEMSLHEIAKTLHMEPIEGSLGASTLPGLEANAYHGSTRTRIAVRLGCGLKTRLQSLAEDDNRNLTNFIEFELHQLVSNPNRIPIVPMPRRHERRPYLYVWLDVALRTKLRKLAFETDCTLTDFVEMSLHQMCEIRHIEANKLPLTGAGTGRQPNPRNSDARRQITPSLNPRLKSKLQRLAEEDYRNLTNFVEFKLHQLASDADVKPMKPGLRRERRDARLRIRLPHDLKMKLQKMADQEYRTLTDFVELNIRQAIVDTRVNSPGSL